MDEMKFHPKHFIQNDWQTDISSTGWNPNNLYMFNPVLSWRHAHSMDIIDEVEVGGSRLSRKLDPTQLKRDSTPKGWADVVFAGLQDQDWFWEIGKNFDQIVEISLNPGEITF